MDTNPRSELSQVKEKSYRKSNQERKLSQIKGGNNRQSKKETMQVKGGSYHKFRNEATEDTKMKLL